MRRRLVVILLTLAGLGMAVVGVIVTAQLRSFLYDRVDTQLADAGAGRGPLGGFGNPPSGSPTFDTQRRIPEGLRLFLADASSDGKQVVVLSRPLRNGQPIALPRLDPTTLTDRATAPGAPARPFTVGSSSSTRYRMVVRQRADGTLGITALTLTEVDDTVSRLILIEVLVGAAALAVLAAVALWAVRLGLRPLERMATAAGEVASGDDLWRVEPADDRSEVGRLGKALNTMLERLERSFASQRASEERLRRFLSDASHELRTPLTSIRGYAELFRRGAADRPDDLAKAMSRIEAEASRMGLLVEDLLVLARHDEERPLDLASVDLATVVSDSVADARAAQPERPWALSTPAEVVVTGSERELRQVMANLLANVRAHTPAEVPCEVTLEAPAGRQGARITVVDHGPGVGDELADRIFERFATADTGRSRSHDHGGGTGLGLSIVASIAEAHGGSARYSPTPGGGVTITVELPEGGPDLPLPADDAAGATGGGADPRGPVAAAAPPPAGRSSGSGARVAPAPVTTGSPSDLPPVPAGASGPAPPTRPDAAVAGTGTARSAALTRLTQVAPWGPILLAFFLGAWHTERSGDANAFYAVAVQSMAKSWHNFFFNAYDAGGFIAIDKPPVAFWAQALSVKVFGYSSWSILLPEALAGAGAVGFLYLAVRRVWGRTAGLVAATALALTPVSVAVSRDNNPDAMLVLLLVAAAWCMTVAVQDGRLRWLIAAAALVGLGFNTKMLAAFIVVPGIWLAYLVASRTRWWRRVLHLSIATAVLLAVSASWAVAVDLTPASSRPYVGGSTDNTVRDLIFGYNGFGRVDGQDQTRSGGRGRPSGRFAPGAPTRPGANAGRRPTAGGGGTAGPGTGPTGPGGATPGGRRVGPAPGAGAATSTQPGPFAGGFRAGAGGRGAFANPLGGPSGITRLTTSAVGDQIAWLFPLAGAGAVVGLVAVAVERRRDAQLGSLLLWTGWGAAAFCVFSFSQGIFHPYYVSLLAPAVAALAGIGLVTFVGAVGLRRVLAGLGALAVVGTAVAEIVLARRIEYAPWVRGLVGAAALVAAAALLLQVLPNRLLERFHLGAGFRRLSVVGAAAALLVLPGLWSWNGAQQPTAGVFPEARPTAPARARQHPNANRGSGTGVIGGPQGDQRGLIRYLEAHRDGATWIVAVASSNQAAPLTLQSGQPVMAYGGFNGTDPAMTRSELVDLVRSGKLRFVLAGGEQIGAQAGRTAPGRLNVSGVVTSACTLVPATAYGGTGTGFGGGGFGGGGFGGGGFGGGGFGGTAPSTTARAGPTRWPAPPAERDRRSAGTSGRAGSGRGHALQPPGDPGGADDAAPEADPDLLGEPVGLPRVQEVAVGGDRRARGQPQPRRVATVVPPHDQQQLRQQHRVRGRAPPAGGVGHVGPVVGAGQVATVPAVGEAQLQGERQVRRAGRWRRAEVAGAVTGPVAARPANASQRLGPRRAHVAGQHLQPVRVGLHGPGVAAEGGPVVRLDAERRQRGVAAVQGRHPVGGGVLGGPAGGVVGPVQRGGGRPGVGAGVAEEVMAVGGTRPAGEDDRVVGRPVAEGALDDEVAPVPGGHPEGGRHRRGRRRRPRRAAAPDEEQRGERPGRHPSERGRHVPAGRGGSAMASTSMAIGTSVAGCGPADAAPGIWGCSGMGGVGAVR